MLRGCPGRRGVREAAEERFDSFVYIRNLHFQGPSEAVATGCGLFCPFLLLEERGVGIHTSTSFVGIGALCCEEDFIWRITVRLSCPGEDFFDTRETKAS